jgi:hypothetical protein
LIFLVWGKISVSDWENEATSQIFRQDFSDNQALLTRNLLMVLEHLLAGLMKISGCLVSQFALIELLFFKNNERQ